MIGFRSQYALRIACSLVCATLILGVADQGLAQVLFHEDFADEMLAENAMVNANVTIGGGAASFNDPDDARATFTVVQEFTDPVMTFSFDMVEPIVDLGNTMEVVLRAGVGTAHNTLQSADFIFEAILFRGGNRGDFMNNGDETIFLVANNQPSDITFASPMDGTDVTLMGYQYIPYVRDNVTDTWGTIKGIDDFEDRNGAEPGPGTITRFGIGSSSNNDIGTFAMDNVLVVSGVSFDQTIGPPPVFGDVDGDGIGGEFPDDFNPIRANFRKNVSARTEGDLVPNGIVDFADFDEWKTAFLGGGGALADVDFSFLATVPEPTSVGLIFAALATVAICTTRNRGNGRNQISVGCANLHKVD